MKKNCHSSWNGEKPFCLLCLITNCIYDGGINRQNQKTRGCHSLLLVQVSDYELSCCRESTGLPLEDAKCKDIGRLVWWKSTCVLWRDLCPPSPTHKQAPKLKSDVYLQRVGRGYVSWAGRCCSSWGCCGGRQSFHLAGDVAWSEQRNQTGCC